MGDGEWRFGDGLLLAIPLLPGKPGGEETAGRRKDSVID